MMPRRSRSNIRPEGSARTKARSPALLENRSGTTAFVVMYLNRSALNISPGERVVLEGVARVQASDKNTQLALGYH